MIRIQPIKAKQSLFSTNESGEHCLIGVDDQHGSPGEPGQDDEHPEEPRQLVRGGDVGQAVDGGGEEELLHYLHPGGLAVTEL